VAEVRTDYRDAEGNVVPRPKAVFDPIGRRMDECIERDCHNAPKHYLFLDSHQPDKDYHTRLCDEHRAECADICEKGGITLLPDPEML
jgi:hypothetical protein